MSTVIAAGTVAAVVEGLAAIGVDPRELCEDAGIDRNALQDATSPVPKRWMKRLWEVSQTKVGLSCLAARVGLAVPFGTLGLLDYLYASTPTIRESFRALVARFGGIASDFTFALREPEALVEIVGTPVPEVEVTEFALGLLLGRCRGLCRSEPEVLEVALRMPEPDARPHEAVYDAPVRYGAESSWVRFSPGTLDLEIQSPDRALFQTLDQLADKLGIGSAGPHLELALRKEIIERLPTGEVSAADIARALNMSERSLSRRLSESGLSFRGLVDRTRAAEAERRLLSEERVVDVAHALGYADQSAFSRAFRRWRGESPARWLAQARRLA